MLSHKNIIVNVRDKDGNTPLHIVAMKGQIDCVEALLAHNDVDITIENNRGQKAHDVSGLWNPSSEQEIKTLLKLHAKKEHNLR